MPKKRYSCRLLLNLITSGIKKNVFVNTKIIKL